MGDEEPLPLREKVREARMRGRPPRSEGFVTGAADNVILEPELTRLATPHPAFGHLLPQGEKGLIEQISARPDV